MSVFLIAQKTDQNVIKGQQYELGGLLYNSENAVLFDCPGQYSLSDVFGVNREFVLEAIKINKPVYYDSKLNIKGKEIDTHYFYNPSPLQIVYLIDNQIHRLESDEISF